MKTFLFTLLTFSAFSIQAATYVPQGNVEFTAKGFPTFITIKGKGDGIKGSLEIKDNRIQSAIIEFPLKTLQTGMDLRDKHMHEKYLETSKYPTAILKLTPFTLNNSGEVEGELKLHNITKKVKVTYETESISPLVANAEFSIVLGDFGIKIPSFQGITVAKDISLAVSFKANKK